MNIEGFGDLPDGFSLADEPLRQFQSWRKVSDGQEFFPSERRWGFYRHCRSKISLEHGFHNSEGAGSADRERKPVVFKVKL